MAGRHEWDEDDQGEAYREQDGHDETLSAYLREIAQVPMLTAEQEIELAQRIEQDDQTAFDAMVQANLRLVVSVAKRYRGQGLSLPDLIQEGNIGLMRAVQRYDWRRGHRFSTHATWWIRQAITRAIADKGRTIRLPVYVSTDRNRVRRARQRLVQELGRNPSPEEVAEAVGIATDRMHELQTPAQVVCSLDEIVGETENRTLADCIPDTDSPSPDDIAARSLVQDAVRLLLEQVLTERERRIIELRFGLAGSAPLSLEDVGRQVGVTRERIRQLEQIALRKLRAHPVARSLV